MFLRPKGKHRITLEIERSRFITSVCAVEDVEAARAFLREIQAEMPDADHHVYAFCTGHGNSRIEGMSDDGEPSGTGGPPTLAVLRGSNLGDIVLVTSRYFGGVKLGTGGLVRAYSQAAQQALATLPTERKILKSQLLAEITYNMFNPLKNILADYSAEIVDEDFSAVVNLCLKLPTCEVSRFISALQDLTQGQVTIVQLSES
jgi:uncharacterized YigZ family protein